MLTAIIVGLVVGAFSGLLGSIAGPQISHVLDRKRRSEIRREERNRDLRRMMETLMRLARTTISSSAVIYMAGYQVSGAPGQDRLEQAWQSYRAYVMRLDQMFPDFIWRPKRIPDDDLRKKATDLNSEQTQLVILLRKRFGMPDSDVQAWETETAERVATMERLLEEVDERMDELGW